MQSKFAGARGPAAVPYGRNRLWVMQVCWLHSHRCLLAAAQIRARRDAFRMQLGKVLWTREVPSLCFFLPCATVWPSLAKSVNEDNILSCFNHIMVKAPNRYYLNVKNGRKKMDMRAAVSSQNKVNVGNYSCPAFGEGGETSGWGLQWCK